VQPQQDHHRPGGLPPPAVQVAAQLLDLAAWTLGDTLTGCILITTSPAGRTMWATSIQPPARLMSTTFSCRSHRGLHAELRDRRLVGYLQGLDPEQLESQVLGKSVLAAVRTGLHGREWDGNLDVAGA
jgi:hypothetical protein